ncbi:UvrD-helicase domain-containing protein [Microbacterium sp. YY-01]|uniref:UvrD-helicase domain-containing protein n=1 Tax=Microbacterium sp. YY-01 TaxID=3421634 RepID=UPI003D178B5F
MTNTPTPTPAWSGNGGLSASDVAIALGLPQPTQQQEAVIEAPPVPTLVVAGAGSGKTETMAGRVVWLVANGHVRRDQVLGLTFTRKAAGELAERIERRLARIDEYAQRGLLAHLPELARSGELDSIDHHDTGIRMQQLTAIARRYSTSDKATTVAADALLVRPHVSTYNAFADALVRDNAAYIGRDPEAGMLSGAASWLIAREIVIDSDETLLAEKDYALSSLVDAVITLASEALDHHTDLATIEKFAATTAEQLQEFTNPALQSPGDIERAHTAVEALALLARLARTYGATKQALSVLDFADQVSGALQAIHARPSIMAEYRDQYRIVLLDEYQDTSVLQTELLSTLFSDTAVMAVGDPHQSIYGWRGASADNLATFAEAFSRETPAARHDLTVSWRNDRAILTAANALLAPAGTHSSLTVEPLQPRPGADRGRIDWVYSETVDNEADEVAAWFQQQRAEHAASGTSKPHTGAILFRAKKHMAVFAEALERHGVPHRVLGLGGLIHTPEVTDIVAVLRVIDDPTQGSSLLRILAGPRFAMGVADLAALESLARHLARRDESLQPLGEDLAARLRASAGTDEQGSIIDALDVLRSLPAHYQLLKNFSPDGHTRLIEASEMFARLRRTAMQVSIPELLRSVEAELRLDIELMANETRGHPRNALVHVRAFADEVRGFLDVSPRGNLNALLAWLDRAEQADELIPRPEPPEPGVVQLLTVHGSKGLEWDAVAVPRMVKDEIPQKPQSTMGWLSLGRLPHRFRGDYRALPDIDLHIDTSTTVKDLRGRLTQYKTAMKTYLLEEERRLAYVAITRARSNLLLSGSWWAGQSKPRTPSSYSHEIAVAVGLPSDHPASPESTASPENTDNPYSHSAETLNWPIDALGQRRRSVEDAAHQVYQAQQLESEQPQKSYEPTPALRRLLAERDSRRARPAASAPTRVPASRFKDYVTDYAATVESIYRPMPEKPYRQTRLGTLFHAWVEHRSGMTGASTTLDDALWEHDDDTADGGALTAADAEQLQQLQNTFEQSPWAHLQPISVEEEINFALHTGTESHIVICKLDAVYRRNGRIEIVDWKTGQPPRSQEEKDDRMLQLALYRLAYHRRYGIPMDDIDVVLYYVGDDITVRADRDYSEDELVQRWIAARAAR